LLGNEVADRLLGLSVRRQGPNDIFLPPVLGDLHAKHESMAAGIEVGRLGLLERRRLDSVCRSERDNQLFPVVPVDVPEHHVEGTVAVLFPALEERSDALSREILQLLSVKRAGGGDDQRTQPRPPDKPAHKAPCAFSWW